MKRNRFDWSHTVELPMKMGQLAPCAVFEVMPGAQLRANSNVFLRAMPLQAPCLTPVRVMTNSYYCPFRILWPDFYDFISGGESGEEMPKKPYIISPPVTGWLKGSLADFLGMPVGVPDLRCDALVFRAYAFVYNRYYRDQDLEDLLPIGTMSGLDTVTSTVLQNVAWEKDYFTLARPWTQRGPQAMLPLGTSAPVRSVASPGVSDLAGLQVFNRSTAAGVTAGILATGGGAVPHINGTGYSAGSPQIDVALEADLTEATAASIRDLRIASAFQRYMEIMAIFGARPAEYLRAVWGVKSADARLQDPEYLSGGIDTVQWSEVLQTAPSVDDPVGALKGHGIMAMRSNRFKYFFPEHGWVITLVSAKPKTLYAQGLPRMYQRWTKEDYFNPFFQHVGMQEVRNSEIYATGTDSDDDTFGFNDRYQEYRSMPNRIVGDLRDELDYWTLARLFDSAPALNADFVKANPSPRIFADQTGTQFIMTVHNRCDALLPIAKHADYRLK